jgi:hypothetical protein
VACCRYLLSKLSGPFVVPGKAQSQIAFSCMRYLKTAQVFISQPHQQVVAAQVIKGFHEFFSYAHEFWFDHLSMAAAGLSGDEEHTQALQLTSAAFWDAFKKKPREQSGANSDPTEESQPTETTPEIHSEVISLCPFVRDFVIFKHQSVNLEKKDCHPLGMKRRALIATLG